MLQLPIADKFNCIVDESLGTPDATILMLKLYPGCMLPLEGVILIACTELFGKKETIKRASTKLFKNFFTWISLKNYLDNIFTF